MKASTFDKIKTLNNVNPFVDDAIKPDFRVFWCNRSTCETGNSTFFTFEFGAEIIKAVFNTMYPEREILKISELQRKMIS